MSGNSKSSQFKKKKGLPRISSFLVNNGSVRACDGDINHWLCSQSCVSAQLVISPSCQGNVTFDRGSQPASVTPRSQLASLLLSNELCRRMTLVLHKARLSFPFLFISFFCPLCYSYFSFIASSKSYYQVRFQLRSGRSTHAISHKWVSQCCDSECNHHDWSTLNLCLWAHGLFF